MQRQSGIRRGATCTLQRGPPRWTPYTPCCILLRTPWPTCPNWASHAIPHLAGHGMHHWSISRQINNAALRDTYCSLPTTCRLQLATCYSPHGERASSSVCPSPSQAAGKRCTPPRPHYFSPHAPTTSDALRARMQRECGLRFQTSWMARLGRGAWNLRNQISVRLEADRPSASP